MQRAQELALAGKLRLAVTLVEEAASAGDPEALLALANWKLFGVYGPRDASAAHQYLERVARSGSAEAARMWANLVGNGTGCEADPARARNILRDFASADSHALRQLAMLDEIKLQDTAQWPVEVMSTTPPVRVLRGLLLPSECAYLRSVAEPELRPSFVVDPRSGKRIPHPIRDSSGMNFGPPDEDLVIQAINRRIATATGTPFACGEPLQILRYAPGQQYKPHLDSLPSALNQRDWTVLVWLNDGYSGGETDFPELGIRVRGNPGDALVFRNISETGEPDHRTRHAGRPVSSGVKWLASRWIRQTPFSPWE